MWQVSGRSNITDLALAEAMYYEKPAVTFTIPGSGVNYVCLNSENGIEVENRNVEKCIIYVCEAHGKSIEEIYNDDDFRKIDRIEGQSLRYGLLTILLRMLHLFVYEIPEKKDYKLLLSNLSRLIPSDFYGNRVSTKPEYSTG